MDTNSISNTISKESVYESFSMVRATMDDAASRLADGGMQESISNEEIREGDEILDTYRVESDALHGGMGSVWEVYHMKWNTHLAMKRPQPRFFAEGSGEKKEAFIAECDHWISLGMHPNIVSCYYVREIGGVPSVFSEWMDGGSLKDRIRDKSLYQGSEAEVQERILDIAIQSARGLKYSHERDLIHLDVKPGNLLLTKEWDCKVADFGLARAGQYLADSNDHTLAGYTLQYCPKEQVEGEQAEPWMDVYSWALTVLEMYAGERFWKTGADAFSAVFGESRDDTWRLNPPDQFLKILREEYKEGNSPGRRTGFAGMVTILEEIYRDLTGNAYPRERAKGIMNSADSLNNAALSYLDLGRDMQAQECWQRALSVNPVHVESVVNEGLWLWRNAKISDLEMADRILYLGREHLVHSEREYHRYLEIRDSFWAEADNGMTAAFPFGGIIRRDENLVRGRDDSPGGNSLYQHAGIVREIRLEDDRIIYTMEDIDEASSTHMTGGTEQSTSIHMTGGTEQSTSIYTYAFDLLSGQLVVKAHTEETAGPETTARQEETAGSEKTTKPEETAGPETKQGKYLFYLNKTDQIISDCDMVLQIRQAGSGKILRTLGVERWDAFRDSDGAVQSIYPMLLTDYKHHRLIFASETEFLWSVYEMPEPPETSSDMPYQLLQPVPFHIRNAEDQERERCRTEFRKSLAEQDFAGMLAQYNRLWKLPLTGDNSDQAWMNGELMHLCRLSGIYHPGPGIEVYVTDHSEEDPLPVDLNGILPLAPNQSRDAAFSDGSLSYGGAFRDDTQVHCSYIPWTEEDDGRKRAVKIFIWDKKEQEMHERMIRFDFGDREIRRVCAVSSQGHFLVLELRSHEDCAERERDRDAFEVVCVSVNGRWQAEMMKGYSDCVVRAVFLEDQLHGPNRGYLWLENTGYLFYFEQEGESFYVDENPRSRSRVPEYLPQNWVYDSENSYHGRMEEIFPEEWDYPHEKRRVIESVMLSPNGYDMAMVLLEREREGYVRQAGYRRKLFLWRKGNQSWDVLEPGRPDRILLTRDFRYMLIGEKAGTGKTVWSWTLYPVSLERKQRPLWEMMEFTSNSRISAISNDLCSLLDDRGRPVYAMCWRYREGTRQGSSR